VYIHHVKNFYDLETVSEIVWGPVALVCLYKGLTACTAPSVSTLTDYMTLLQVPNFIFYIVNCYLIVFFCRHGSTTTSRLCVNVWRTRDTMRPCLLPTDTVQEEVTNLFMQEECRWIAYWDATSTGPHMIRTGLHGHWMRCAFTLAGSDVEARWSCTSLSVSSGSSVTCRAFLVILVSLHLRSSPLQPLL
jgi:hypothetical protein